MQNNSAAPDGYNSVQPYLIVKDAAAAIAFYERAFGASERLCMEGPDGTVGHAEIVIGNACVMLADEHPAIGAYAPEHYGGSPISPIVYVDDCDAVYSRALSAGAESLREPPICLTETAWPVSKIRSATRGISAQTSRNCRAKSWKLCKPERRRTSEYTPF